MKQSIILWLGAFVITFLSGYLQSITSPYYPITGTIGVEGNKVSYKFDKVYRSKDEYRVIIRSDRKDLTGKLQWKKKGEGELYETELKLTNEIFFAEIPKQLALTKIEYRVILSYQNKSYFLPKENFWVKLEFLGKVSLMIMFMYNLTLFGALLLSFRTALEFFNENEKIKKLTLFTVSTFFINTFVFGSLKRSYELDAIGKKILPISAMFSIESILIFLVWLTTMILIFNIGKYRIIVLVAGIITLIIFQAGNF